MTASLPGPSIYLPGAHLLAFRRNALNFLLYLSQTYGDVVAFRLGPERVVLLTHPDHVRQVLVHHTRSFVKGRRGDVTKRYLGEGLLNSEGEVHHRQRRLVQPAFHRDRLVRYAEVMVTYGAALSQQWRHGESRDIAQAMAHVTLAIVGKTLFNTDVEAEAQQIGAAMTTLIQLSPRFNLPFADLLTKLPLPSHTRLRQAQQVLDTTLYRLIAECRQRGGDQGDLLSMLLLARDDTTDGTGMTDKQVHDEALTLMLAGHETTAVALTWTWYLLAQHPEAEAALHRELDTVLGGRLPTEADLPQLRYTRMVLAESMRLYPPAWLMTRRALEDYELGGHLIPKGRFILISPYITHHDARFFAAPETFQPERWRPENEASQTRFAYFPFGGGPRQCIGEGFAWMEAMLLIATLAQHWRLRLEPGHPVDLMPLVTLRPKFGMRMRLQRR